jgi:hypothetical protein
MPIRVNLKEIFPSDPQEINVEKLNFNFNKLLELGVGSPGPIGLTGPQGPAGPVGLVGPQGDRGATWWVDAGDPNTLTFTGLIDGDLYLDQTSTTFEVYQYDDTTSTWTSVVSIAAIVNAYLSTAAPSPFTTGPTGIPASSTKFVIFDTSDQVDPNLDYINDFTRGTFNTSNNKSLLLANFNETAITTPPLPLIWPANQNSLYTSLFKVVAAHDDAPLSVRADLGRYHIEFGSLYNDSSNILLSDLKHNLKGKFYKRYIGLGAGELPLTNEWINTAKFSLSTPEPFTLVDVDQNGEFEFVVPKYNSEGPLVREEVSIRLGSAEAFAERTNKATILADGISITNDQVGRSMVIGLREDLGAVLDLPYSSTNFALFDVSDDVDGLFFNKTLVQTGGNIDQLITTPLTILDIETLSTTITSGHYMNQGIIVSSNTLLISSGAGNTQSNSSNGLIARYDISNPALPAKFEERSGNRTTTGSSTPFGSDQHGHAYLDSSGLVLPTKIGLIKDIAEFGKYFISILGKSPTGTSGNFFISEVDSRLNNVLTISATSIPEITTGYRVQVNGKYAWVITNDTFVTGPQLSSGSPTYSSLTAIDLSNPGIPVVIDTYLETQPGTKYLDFKIADNKAYVLRYTNYIDVITPANSVHSLDLLTFDILDPLNFSTLSIDQSSFMSFVPTSYTPADIQNLETLPVNTTRTEYGGLEVHGNEVYVCWENNLYIVSILTSSSLISTTALSSSQVYANDVKVSGKYAYVLVNDLVDLKGAVQVYDIRTISSPVLCSETRDVALRNSSRLAIHGKHIYVVSSTIGSKASIVSLDLHGISSPSAELGSLLSSDLHVSGSAVVRNNLHVKNSINVGPGGIYVDEGQGVAVDGNIVGQNIIGQNIIGNHTAIRVNNNSVNQVIPSSLLGTVTAQFSTKDYDLLNEFNTSTNRFTAKEDGYYQFIFHGALFNSTTNYFLIVGQIFLEDTFANSARLSTVYNGASTSESPSEYVLNDSRPNMTGSAVMYVAAGDWVQVKYNCYAADVTNTPIDMSMYLQELTINKIV